MKIREKPNEGTFGHFCAGHEENQTKRSMRGKGIFKTTSYLEDIVPELPEYIKFSFHKTLAGNLSLPETAREPTNITSYTLF